MIKGRLGSQARVKGLGSESPRSEQVDPEGLGSSGRLSAESRVRAGWVGDWEGRQVQLETSKRCRRVADVDSEFTILPMTPDDPKTLPARSQPRHPFETLDPGLLVVTVVCTNSQSLRLARRNPADPGTPHGYTGTGPGNHPRNRLGDTDRPGDRMQRTIATGGPSHGWIKLHCPHQLERGGALLVVGIPGPVLQAPPHPCHDPPHPRPTAVALPHSLHS
eukprot:1401959-Rhodomonas_salina.1